MSKTASVLDTGTSGSTPVGYHDLPWPSAASGTHGLLEPAKALALPGAKVGPRDGDRPQGRNHCEYGTRARMILHLTHGPSAGQRSVGTTRVTRHDQNRFQADFRKSQFLLFLLRKIGLGRDRK